MNRKVAGTIPSRRSTKVQKYIVDREGDDMYFVPKAFRDLPYHKVEIEARKKEIETLESELGLRNELVLKLNVEKKRLHAELKKLVSGERILETGVRAKRDELDKALYEEYVEYCRTTPIEVAIRRISPGNRRGNARPEIIPVANEKERMVILRQAFAPDIGLLIWAERAVHHGRLISFEGTPYRCFSVVCVEEVFQRSSAEKACASAGVKVLVLGENLDSRSPRHGWSMEISTKDYNDVVTERYGPEKT